MDQTQIQQRFQAAFRAHQFVVRQPGWVARVAAGAGLVVFLAVLALLVIPALIVAAAVFCVGAAWVGLRLWVRGFFSRPGRLSLRDDGRRNVRVRREM